MSTTPLVRHLVALALAATLAFGWAGAREAHAWTTIYNCNNAWPSSDLPVEYRVSSDVESVGTAASNLEALRALYRAAFDEWATPCCSAFSATDVGTTTASAENTNDNINAVTILTDRWPRSLGDANSTLGVTVVQVDGRCDIMNSDVVFNAFRHSYSNGGGGNTTDFQSIAVHEFGHFLGLGHTNIFEATMYPAYTGPGGRTLHSDDQEGVCALYTQPCSCSGNGDCNGNQDCIDSVCQIPPCTSNLDCDPGLECNNSGDCVVPPCSDAGDCVSGQVCQAGSCVTDADCPICGECSSNADCGTNGICIPAGYISEASACTSWCESAADCPGNTDCFLVPTDEGDVPLCFNDDADTRGPCPGSFVCESDDGPFNPCDGVTCPAGQSCNSLTGQCQGGGGGDTCAVCDECSASADVCGASGTCLSFIDGPTVCSVACGADGSCPGNSSCFQLAGDDDTVENWCLNADAQAAGVCGGAWTCESAGSLCEGVSCGSGETCNPSTGACEGGGDERDLGPPGGDAGQGAGGSGDDSGGCFSVTRQRSVGDAAWLLLALGALVVGWRRRR